MYTSRQLLDPNQIMSFYNKRDEAVQKGWESLGNLAQYIGDKVEEQNRKDYLAKDRNVDKIEDLPEWKDPQFRAASYSFMKGDRSGIDNYYQTKALNKAREEEALKAKEEQNRLNEANFDLAVQDIDTYKNDPERKINAIKKAISVGDVAGKNTTELKELLKKEQDDLEDSILATRYDEIEAEKQKIEEADYEAEKNEVKDKLKDRLKKLPKNAEARNAEIEEISKIAYMYGLTGLDIPEFATIKKTLTPKEQDEYNDLLDLKNDGRLVKTEDIRRFNWLSQYVK